MSLFTNGLQARLLRESADAPNMSAAMNHAAFNFANALGAFLGGVVITAGWGYRAPAAVGVLLALAGTLVLLVAFAVAKRGKRSAAPVGDEGINTTDAVSTETPVAARA